MSARKIKRGGKAVRSQARAQGARRRVSSARRKTGSLVDWLMRYLPFTEEQLQKGFLVAILLGAFGAAWIVASLAGVPEMARYRIAEAATHAGFEAQRVDVRGVDRVNQLRIYNMVLGREQRSMTEIDLAAVRAEVMELSWVKDARVSRQLPDTIVVDIVEREPHAALQKPGRLVLIDATGHELEPISPANAKGMLRISGPGAQRQVESLSALLDAAPALRPQVSAAEWVGNRRWNLTFKTGQVLALPQGTRESAGALIEFARLDGVNRLLGGAVTAFDMRAPERIYLRIPGRAQQQALATAQEATEGEAE